MRLVVAFLLGALTTSGCRYQRKAIFIPPGEDALRCVEEASANYEHCLTYQRGRRFCDQTHDRALLMCPGARLGGPDAGVVEPTYDLPGTIR